MMVAEPQRTATRDEYLKFERASETKHEYIAGEIVAMVGGTARHSQIGANTIATLFAHLRGGPCVVYSSDLRVAIRALDVDTYPDVTVVCGESQFEDDGRTGLLNPTFLVEVLSPSTEGYDRGRKFLRYQRLASFRGYLLIAQDTPLVQHFAREADGRWFWSGAEGLDASIALPALGCTLALADLYAGVTFD